MLKVRRYSGCPTLFTFSGLRSLQHLQEMEISDCAFVEKIAEDAEMSGMNNKTITLSHLEILILKDLPKLKSIFHGANYRCHVPSLRDVDVEDCGLSNLFSFSELTSLKTLKISRCAHLEEIVEDEVSDMNKKTITFSHLNKVTLKDLPKLKSFMYGGNHECPLLPNLYSVNIHNCGLSSLFMCSAAFGSLQRLAYLKVRDCRMFEGIFEYASGDETSGTTEQIITLSKLESLRLSNLPNLKSFIHGANYNCYMPTLRNIEVYNCGFSTLFTCSDFKNLPKLGYLEVLNCRMLEGIFEYARGDETSSTSEQIIIKLLKLWSLTLINLPELKSFIHGANYDCYMPALTEIEVDNCEFSTLFTCSDFKNLQKLEYLKVSNCRLLEVVVEDARGDETSGTNDKTITLPVLENIELEHLPNLKSFSRDENCAFNMIRLEFFRLVGCPGVENFTCFNTHTGKGSVCTDDQGDEWREVSDLNHYIKTLFKEDDVAVPEMKRLVSP